MKVCFMGLGYIGLPTAIIAAQSGIEVTGVDINPKVVELTNRGIIHIVEPGLQGGCNNAELLVVEPNVKEHREIGRAHV